MRARRPSRFFFDRNIVCFDSKFLDASSIVTVFLSGIILKRHMGVKEEHRDKIAEAFADPEIITEALAQGVREALLKHKQAGNPIIVWRDGKAVRIKPEEILVS